MSVYVDCSMNMLGRMKMCHMIADTPTELRTMAEKLNLNPAWFQKRSSAPHFDISKSKREEAVAASALVLDRRAFVAAFQRIRLTWPTKDGNWLLKEER